VNCPEILELKEFSANFQNHRLSELFQLSENYIYESVGSIGLFGETPWKLCGWGNSTLNVCFELYKLFFLSNVRIFNCNICYGLEMMHISISRNYSLWENKILKIIFIIYIKFISFSIKKI
jgi:hypothetical protein